jgi:hypothetical protein
MVGINVLVLDKEKELFLKGTVNGKEVGVKEFMVFYLDPDEELLITLDQ